MEENGQLDKQKMLYAIGYAETQVAQAKHNLSITTNILQVLIDEYEATYGKENN